ncbi:hypothetical protein [Staphylococcus equorum]|uniref:hypothetical protein n=1 Tax=Staphylococcus equorum TaxID=246432 RepID=UPI003D8062B2
MKKIFVLFLMSFLVLAACSNENESNSDEKKSQASENKSEKRRMTMIKIKSLMNQTLKFQIRNKITLAMTHKVVMNHLLKMRN